MTILYAINYLAVKQCSYNHINKIIDVDNPQPLNHLNHSNFWAWCCQRRSSSVIEMTLLYWNLWACLPNTRNHSFTWRISKNPANWHVQLVLSSVGINHSIKPTFTSNRHKYYSTETSSLCHRGSEATDKRERRRLLVGMWRWERSPAARFANMDV